MEGLWVIFLFYGLFFVVSFGGLGVAIWALVDALGKPEWAWQYAGENRTLYLVFLGISLFMCPILAWIPAIMYFKGAKPRVVAVMAAMPQFVPGPYGSTPQGYPGQYGGTPQGHPGHYGGTPQGHPGQSGYGAPAAGWQPAAPGTQQLPGQGQPGYGAPAGSWQAPAPGTQQLPVQDQPGYAAPAGWQQPTPGAPQPGSPTTDQPDAPAGPFDGPPSAPGATPPTDPVADRPATEPQQEWWKSGQ